VNLKNSGAAGIQIEMWFLWPDLAGLTRLKSEIRIREIRKKPEIRNAVWFAPCRLAENIL
jgi:hypothetical protein